MKRFIVIPTHNRCEVLDRLLLQIYSQINEKTFFEVVIVVDGSTDNTLDMLKNKYPRVHIVHGTGDWWYTKSMNEGFKYAIGLGADYILTLNDDIELDKEYLKNIVKHEDSNSIIGSVGYTIEKPHRIITSGVKKIIWWRNKSVHYYKPFSVVNPKDISGLKKSIALPGRGMLIPTKMLKELSFFDDYFLQYHSDTDFCLRAQGSGYNVFICWDCIIYSHVTLTSGTSSFIKSSIFDFIKSFFNKYSRVYIPHMVVFNFRHGIKILAPIRVVISILAQFKAFFFNKKI